MAFELSRRLGEITDWEREELDARKPAFDSLSDLVYTVHIFDTQIARTKALYNPRDQ